MKNQKDIKKLESTTFISKGDVVNASRHDIFDYPLHGHNYFEIELIHSGTGIHRLNGTDYTAKAGDIFLLAPMDFHELHSEKGIGIFNITFLESAIDPDMLNCFLKNTSNKIFSLEKGMFDYMTSIIQKLIFEIEKPLDYSKKYSVHLLNCIFTEIIRMYNLEKENTLNITDTNIQPILVYLQTHFKDNPSLTDVSNMAGLNKNYFCELFRKKVGKNYNNYLQSLKLNYARNLIISSDTPILEICYMSGFSTSSHFLRSFKAEFNTTPTEMRKNFRNIIS